MDFYKYFYKCKPGDEIQVNEKSRSFPFVIDSVQKLERDLPEYINLDVKEFKATYIRYPSSDEIPYPTMMSPGSVVEFYSR